MVDKLKNHKTTLILIGVFAIAFVIRSLGFRNIFTDENVIFLGYDSYYHMRRVLAIVEAGNYISFDSYLNYPYGTHIGWMPIYDMSIAALSLLFGGGVHTTEVIGAIFPALIGALTIIPIFAIASKIFDKKAGLLSALTFSLIPAHIYKSRLGYVDHHVAEVILFALLAYLLISSMRLAGKGDQRRTIFSSILLGIVITIMILTWNGAPIYIGIIGFYGAVQFVVDRYSGRSSDHLTGIMVIASLTSIGMLIPASRLMEIDLKYQLSTIVLILALFLTLGGISHIMMRYGITFRWYLISMAVIAASSYFVVSASSLLGYITGGISYLLRESVVISTVTEAFPLSIEEALYPVFTTSLPIGICAFLIFVYLKILKIDETRNEEIFFIVWTVFAFILAFTQKRFVYFLSANLSILCGYALIITPKLVESYLGNKKKIATVIFVILMVILFVPQTYASVRVSTMEPKIIRYGWYEPLEYLSANTPQTSYYYNASKTPEYGVICWWDCGNWILYTAQRPVIANNFQVGVSDAARFYAAESEDAANNILDKRKARYIMTDLNMGFIYLTYTINGTPTFVGTIIAYGKFGDLIRLAGKNPEDYYDLEVIRGERQAFPNEKFYNTTYARLYLFDGSDATIHRWNVSPLAHYRLIWESNRTVFNIKEREIKRVKIFEYVPGAVLSGKVESNQDVKISLRVKTNRNQIFVYENSVRSDEDGMFRVTLPYSTKDAVYETKGIGNYEVKCGNMARSIEVREEDVISGAEIVLDWGTL
jgi:dolichyl-diphosphooligosaccharide--protein glycosyltransferase